MKTGIPDGQGPKKWSVEKWLEVGWSEIIELDSEAKALECAAQASAQQPHYSWRVCKKETRWMHIAKKEPLVLSEKFNCDGCGKMLDDDVYSSHPYVTVDTIPDRRLRVCSSRRSAAVRGAKKICLIAALEKTSACSGCGKHLDFWPLELICEACGKKLDMADRIQADEDAKRVRVGFEMGKIKDRYVDGAEAPSLDGLLESLAKAVSSTAVVSLTRGWKVYVTKGQSEAIGEVEDKLVAFWRAARAVGFNEGRGLLMGLATGKITTDQFSEREIEKARRTQGS